MQRVVARARPGHPWVFSNEVVDPPVSALPVGGTVDVYDPRGRALGVGYANPRSLIAIRLVGVGADIDGAALYRERIASALAWRGRVMPGRGSLRLVAGEADGLPGLIVDRYADVLSVQVTTLGMERRLDLVRPAVEELCGARAAWLRNDVGVRTLEGLDAEPRAWFGEVPVPVAFEENGLRLLADIKSGQKTGHFFDQADNRAFMTGLARGARVLDVFAHTGAWAVGALVGGAVEAVVVDSSASALALARRNAELNGVRLESREGDARAVMESMDARTFDIVCLDPPSFAKSRKGAAKALGAYRQVNTAAARLVRTGGLLFTSSCSHHVLAERFEEAVRHGVRAAGRSALMIRRGGQSPDHPVLPSMPESEYLKHLVLVVH